MGIPKLFRWLAERYPQINRKAAELPPPQFHNLYFDLNGVIHNATHSNDESVSYSKDPVAVASAVFGYIERVFAVVGPTRLLFIAVDGVAPRAKVNQQRQRRFKSAKETVEGLEAAKAAARAARAARRAVAAEEAAALGDGEGSDLGSESDSESDDEAVDEHKVFDSNCITPGTEFMAALVAELRYFVAHKMATDAEWQAISVVVSGPDVPGEGEHKIMDFIRAAKSSPGYDPNTSHCLHGLDADLIMLGLATHEPHFTLVREKVVFGQTRVLNERSAVAVQQTDDFEFLHLSVLREYLLNEFRPVTALPFPFDAERLLDDFVFMCFFIGNDFLPPLPLMDIDKGGLKVVFETYKSLLPSWSTWLVSAHDGVINPDALQALFDALRAREARVMRALHDADADYPDREASAAAAAAASAAAAAVAASRPLPPAAAMAPAASAAAWGGAAAGADAPPVAAPTQAEGPADAAATMMLKQMLGVGGGESSGGDDAAGGEEGGEEGGDDDDGGEAAPDFLLSMAHLLNVSPESLLGGEKKRRKRKKEPTEQELAGMSTAALTTRQKEAWWYADKFVQMGSAAPETYVGDVVSQYIQGLAWNLSYYYQGVLSWSWFYGYYCAPLLADMGSIRSASIVYDTTSGPFAPFEQLMAVLPHYSASLLPDPIAALMTEPSSPLAPYFPSSYGYIADDSGRSWKDIALIPFVDQVELQKHVAAALPMCTPEERARNTPGTAFFIRYAPGTAITVPAPPSLPSLPPLVNIPVAIDPYTTPPLTARFVPALCAGAALPPASPLHGFPSFGSLRYQFAIRAVGVQTVASASREPSLILLPDETAVGQIPSGRYLAERYLGKTVYAGWPYLVEARVEAVSTPRLQFYAGDTYDEVCEDVCSGWGEIAASVDRQLLVHGGIKLRNIKYVFHVTVLTSLTLLPDGTMHKEYGVSPVTGDELLLPLQLAVRTPPSEDTRYAPRTVSLATLFATGASVVVVGGPDYGAVGTVLELAKESKGKAEASDSDDDADASAGAAAPVHPSAYKVNVAVVDAPNVDVELGHAVSAARAERYSSTHDVAREVGMSQLAVSRITGAVSVAVDGAGGQSQSIHIGLGVKFSGRGLRIVGYARRKTIRTQSGGSRKIWEYSTRTVGLLRSLKAQFPTFVAALNSAADERVYPAATLFGAGQTMLHLRRLLKWLSSLEVASLPLVPDDMTSLSGAAIAELEARLVDAADSAPSAAAAHRVASSIPASHLVNVHTITRTVTPAALPTRFGIGDRVRSIRPAGPIPFGTCGFIVTLRGSLAEVVLDAPILAGSTLSGRLATRRGATVDVKWLLNLSRIPASARPKVDDDAEARAAAAAAAAARRDADAAKSKRVSNMSNPFAALM